MGTGFRVVPKMMDSATLSIWLVHGNGEHLELGRIRLPMDGQMNDNLECAQNICNALRKRIRKSI